MHFLAVLVSINVRIYLLKGVGINNILAICSSSCFLTFNLAGLNVTGISLNIKYLPEVENDRHLEFAENISRKILNIPWTVYTPSANELKAFEQ